MRKLLFAVIVAAAFVGCSKSDDETEQQPLTNNYPCRFNVIYEKAAKPQIKYKDNEKVIDFVISNFEPMLLNLPKPSNTCGYFDYKFAESEFLNYQSHFTCLGNLNPPETEKMYVGKMQNGDHFLFDMNETKATQKIRVTFYCVHL